MSDLKRINDLAFEIIHLTEDTEVWGKADAIFKMTLPPKLNASQRKSLEKLSNNYFWFGKSVEHALYDYLSSPDKEPLSTQEFLEVLGCYVGRFSHD